LFLGENAKFRFAGVLLLVLIKVIIQYFPRKNFTKLKREAHVLPLLFPSNLFFHMGTVFVANNCSGFCSFLKILFTFAYPILLQGFFTHTSLSKQGCNSPQTCAHIAAQTLFTYTKIQNL